MKEVARRGGLWRHAAACAGHATAKLQMDGRWYAQHVPMYMPRNTIRRKVVMVETSDVVVESKSRREQVQLPRNMMHQFVLI